MNYKAYIFYKWVRKFLAGLLNGLTGMWLLMAFMCTAAGVTEYAILSVVMSIASATLSALVTP